MFYIILYYVILFVLFSFQYSPRLRRSPKTTPRSALQRRSREQTDFLRNKIQEANEACQSGEFSKAVQLFSEILTIEPKNSILYCNRSAAYIRMNLFQAALDDSLTSIKLDPEWYKVIYICNICNLFILRFDCLIRSKG